MSPEEPVAQPVEHLTFNQGVMGSNPIGLTNKNNVLSDRIGVEDVGKVAQ
jgi:hypothetical protein